MHFFVQTVLRAFFAKVDVHFLPPFLEQPRDIRVNAIGRFKWEFARLTTPALPRIARSRYRRSGAQRRISMPPRLQPSSCAPSSSLSPAGRTAVGPIWHRRDCPVEK